MKLNWTNPDSKVHGTNMGPIWGRQDLGGHHVGPMNFAIWEVQHFLGVFHHALLLHSLLYHPSTLPGCIGPVTLESATHNRGCGIWQVVTTPLVTSPREDISMVQCICIITRYFILQNTYNGHSITQSSGWHMGYLLHTQFYYIESDIWSEEFIIVVSMVSYRKNPTIHPSGLSVAI